MKGAILLIALWCFAAKAAETNSMPSVQFTPPSLELRAPVAQKETEAIPKDAASSLGAIDLRREPNSSALAAIQIDTPMGDQFSLSARISEREMQVYRRLEEGGYLTRPEPETPIGHFMDRTFSPEIIHLGKGKAMATCTLYTAIKRKNPLCLLNPMFLFISW